MPRYVSCRRCGAAVAVPETGGGSFLWCAECKSAFTAPSGSTEAGDEPVPVVRAGERYEYRPRPLRRRLGSEPRRPAVATSPFGLVGLILLMALFGSALVRSAVDTARESANPEEDAPAVTASQPRPPVLPAPGWKPFASADRTLILRAPVELEPVTPEGGQREAGFTLRAYRGEHGDVLYQVLTVTADRPRADFRSGPVVDPFCDGLIAKIGRARDVTWAPNPAGRVPGRQVTFATEDRYHVGRVAVNGRRLYFWLVSAERPITADDPAAAPFLDSAGVHYVQE
jgi:hypothetical protein